MGNSILESEIINSTKDSIYSKITSPLWGSFVLSWIIWNWQAVYTTVFIRSEDILTKYNILKIEYILTRIYDGNYYYFNLPPFSEYVMYWFIGPILSTMLIIGFIPYLSNYVYKRDISKFKKDRIVVKRQMEKEIDEQFLSKTKEDNNLLSEVQKQLEEKSKKLDEIEKSQKQIQRQESKITEKVIKESDEWDKEYKIMITKYPDLINSLNNLIYQMFGFTRTRGFSGRAWDIFSPQSEQTINSLELVEKFDNKGDELKSGNYYKLTEKGRYFLKKYSLEENS